MAEVRQAKTIAELQALPTKAVVRDRMGWVAVLDEELLDDARAAFMCNFDDLRVVWSNNLPLDVVHLPGEPVDVLLALAAEREHYAVLSRRHFPDIEWTLPAEEAQS